MDTYTTIEELVEGYVQYRLGVWRLNPPVEYELPTLAVEEAEEETWFPVLWDANRGSEESRTFGFDPGEDAGVDHPLFMRATLGVVDSDLDGMDDGWELWHFGELVSPTGDEDRDGLTNLEEYLHGTDPNNPDTDGDGLSDGDEILLGRDPLKRDHPAVELQVFISY